MLLGLLVFLAYAVFLLFAVDRVFLSAGVSQVQIISPPGGFVITEGESVIVEAVARGRRLIGAELWVDEALADSAASTRSDGEDTWHITYAWASQGPGRHQLSVRVFAPSGRMLASPPAVVSVVPGRRIVFASDRDGNYELYRMQLDGRALVRLTDGPEQDREPSCSKAGLVLFASTAPDGGKDVWLTEPGSGDRVNLTAAVGGDYSPRWSPENESIAFISDRGVLSQLYLMKPDGSQQFPLTRQDTYVQQPSWAPDGASLLYTGEERGNVDILSIALDGGVARRLTTDPAQDWYPAWSPMGDQIAFVSNREGSHQIFVAQADGAAPRRLTDFPAGAEQPQWSPDGEWIVFVAYSGHGERLKAREIYIMRPDGSDQMRLTDNASDDTEPSWCD